jgi:hypothetical protein
MSFVAAAVIVGGASLAGAYMSSQAAGKAADQYGQQAERGLQYNREMFDKINAQNAPYRTLGENAAGRYGQFIDNGYFTQQPSMDDLTRLMPNYQFGLNQGMGALNSQLNAAGGLVGGNAIQGAQQFAQGYAGNALTDAFNQFQVNRSNVASNLGAGVNFGQNANTTTANAATGASANASNLLSSIGNAQAAGTMGSANAYAGALNNISNYAMLYGMRSGGGGGTGNSDIRMKQNIEAIGWLPNGLPVYSWDYKPEFKDDKYGGHGKFVGVMAQDVEKLIPDAVITRFDGFKMVNYTKI